ncbi:nucleotidyltransferase domain-containing protein [Sorangium cellulosum]|uniref:Transposase n=1 Tax=Sorangium cellulosum TaxID=56 RepID=A0A150Q1C8_SORCE|nr:nucleotidyltransferase domain-containing protein [Sorangium cellulosum]KYF61769.1 transposase [Sorangium cellulosum]
MKEGTIAQGSAVSRLPAPVQARLTELKESLERTLGDELACLLVYGSAARGGYREGQSDVDLMVVLNEASREGLDAIANALRIARYAARIEAMILTVAEIPRAADVFPLLYDDIRRCHVLLSGRDPFSALVIDGKNRRLRVEQELREAQIRLRRAVVDGLGSDEALRGAVFRKVKQIRGPLHALLGLHGIDGDDDLATVLAGAGKHLGVDVAPLQRVHEAPGAAYEALAALLARAVDDVDGLEHAGAP